ncbi:MAG: response regulator [Ardenticatenaceae bacterium]|nr:response regulator [Ardenticatenaceae bacterium]HBY96866.1 hypothetical protein [Chloroflexota bacterium]
MKTILIVEDERAIAALLSTVLEDEGYRVVMATNGREGLTRLAESLPNLILCDVMMPLLDGIEMCRTLQTNPAYRSVPIVLMTAARRSFSRDHCNYATVLYKPFELDRLLETVAHLIGGTDS